MLYLRIISIIFILLSNVSLYAQTLDSTAIIKGKVLNISQKPAENIIVTLQLVKNSSIIKIAFSILHAA